MSFYSRSAKWFCILAASCAVVSYQGCGEGFDTMISEEFMELSSRAPTITVLQSPDGLINSRDVVIAFKAESNIYSGIESVTCRLDDGEERQCLDSFSASGLIDGDHIVRIVAKDNRGNISQEAAVMFRVDATAPTVTINSAPATSTSETSAIIEFSVQDNISQVTSVECSIGEGVFTSCSSPLSLTNLAEQEHRFRVRARDAAGNMSAETPITWRIDRTAPIINIASGPQAFSNSRAAEFTFSAEDAGQALASLECQLDDGEFSVCTSPRTLASLQDGRHTFRVRATDGAGNQSAVVSRSWTVDSMAPTIQIVSAPASVTGQTSATFQFTASDSGSGLRRAECSLNNRAFTACTSPVSYSNLAVGNHAFMARVTDNANNQASASFTWTITQTAPTPPPAPAPMPPSPPSQPLPPSSGDAHEYFNYLSSLPQKIISVGLRNQSEITANLAAKRPQNQTGNVVYDPVVDGTKFTVFSGTASVDIKDQIRVFWPTVSSGNVLVSWESRWDSRFQSNLNGLQTHKAFQIGNEQNDEREVEVRTRFNLVSTNVAKVDLRLYQWAPVSGPNQPVAGQINDFIIRGDTWTRFWAYVDFDRRQFSLWVADETRAPVQLFNNLPFSNMSGGLNQFWFEYNSSQNRSGGANLYTWGRNLVVLRNIQNAAVLVQQGAY